HDLACRRIGTLSYFSTQAEVYKTQSKFPSGSEIHFIGEAIKYRQAIGMGDLIITWLLSAASLLLVAHLIPGFSVSSFGSALIGAIVIGFVNMTLGFILKVITLPLTILTFGLFLLVINALMLQLATAFVPGFSVQGFMPAFFGAVVLAVINMALHGLVFRS
ncbi:MAG TPA: phage holin family protein, partial [Candidatus Saccharimonadales bacterium]|nr:phage holin family protein [Candidatus Saccharimonadales bacterium]